MGRTGLQDGPPGPYGRAVPGRILGRRRTVVMDRQAVLEDIRSLMQGPLDGDPVEARARVERTLTDGYAHALALEGERLRIERQIGVLTARLGTDGEGAL